MIRFQSWKSTEREFRSLVYLTDVQAEICGVHITSLGSHRESGNIGSSWALAQKLCAICFLLSKVDSSPESQQLKAKLKPGALDSQFRELSFCVCSKIDLIMSSPKRKDKGLCILLLLCVYSNELHINTEPLLDTQHLIYTDYSIIYFKNCNIGYMTTAFKKK